MNRRQKVIWYEGMTLDPHHFQQWDRFQQGVVNSRLDAVVPFGWGITSLDIDKEALANGQFSLKSCRGVLRDGLFFDMPSSDPLPAGIMFDKRFPATDESLGIFLALPAERSGGRNCLLDGSRSDRQTRFVLENITLNDDNTGAEERMIGVGRANFSLRLSGEPLEDFSALQIAAVVRTADGSFTLSSKYIPPSLSIAASEVLMTQTRRLLERLVAKANSLSERRRHQPSGQIEFTTVDVRDYWQLHTINNFIPLLNHHYTVGKCHPETLYVTFLSLSGQLATFSPDTEVTYRELPAYEHANPSECFGQLDVRIRELLEGIGGKNYVKIPLEKRNENQWIGRMIDDQILKSSQFFLTTSGNVPERKVIDELPYKLKIASPEGIDALAAAALQGLRVTHTPRPPAGLPTRSGLEYFKLEKLGPFWEAISRTRGIAIFVPSDFADLRMELVAVRDTAA